MKIPKQLPDALLRRNLLYGEGTPPAQLEAYGELYRAAGRLLDALEFFHRAGGATQVEVLRDQALAEGDAFLLQRWEQLTGDKLAAADWERAAGNAQSRGLEAFARTARRNAGVDQPAAEGATTR